MMPMNNAMNLQDFNQLVANIATLIGGTVLPHDSEYAWPRAQIYVDGVTWIVGNQYPYDKIEFYVVAPKYPKDLNRLPNVRLSSGRNTKWQHMALRLMKSMDDAKAHLVAIQAQIDAENSAQNGRNTTKEISAQYGVTFGAWSEYETSGTVNGHYVRINLDESGQVSRLQVDGLNAEQFQKMMEFLSKL